MFAGNACITQKARPMMLDGPFAVPYPGDIPAEYLEETIREH